MLVQSATSSNFQPRASRIEKAASKAPTHTQFQPLLPRVGARGGPVCRGQVRGSCPPGATLPTKRRRYRYAHRRGSADLIGRWLARGSAILWRSLGEQSVVPGRPRGTQAFSNPVSRLRLSSLCHAVLFESFILWHGNILSLPLSLSLSLSHSFSPPRNCIFVHKCVSRENKLASLYIDRSLSKNSPTDLCT